jgi:hypothetical protein
MSVRRQIIEDNISGNEQTYYWLGVTCCYESWMVIPKKSADLFDGDPEELNFWKVI